MELMVVVKGDGSGKKDDGSGKKDDDLSRL
jgi:hypothetical protein